MIEKILDVVKDLEDTSEQDIVTLFDLADKLSGYLLYFSKEVADAWELKEKLSHDYDVSVLQSIRDSEEGVTKAEKEAKLINKDKKAAAIQAEYGYKRKDLLLKQGNQRVEQLRQRLSYLKRELPF